MSFGRVPEYKMSYEDRVTEEAGAIASSKKRGLEITLPDEEDYLWAKDRVDSSIEESKYRLDGFFGFANGGRQQLVELVGKPIAFVYARVEGKRIGAWDLSSKEIFYPGIDS